MLMKTTSRGQGQSRERLSEGQIYCSCNICISTIHGGQLLMRSLVEDMLKKYPDLSLDLQLEDEFVDVVGGVYDAVVRVGVLADSSSVARRLGTTRLECARHRNTWKSAVYPKNLKIFCSMIVLCLLSPIVNFNYGDSMAPEAH